MPPIQRALTTSIPFIPLILILACQDIVLVDDDGNGIDNGIEGNGNNKDVNPSGTEPTDSMWLENNGISYNGVDILIVIDNSSSMDEEQQILATQIYSLITTLTKPVVNSYPVENIRFAVTTTDMGLQYGAGEGVLDPVPTDAQECKGKGDDGDLMPVSTQVTTVQIQSGRIDCEPYGDQCPTGWTCDAGACMAPSGDQRISCDFDQSSPWLETSPSNPNPDLAGQAACLAIQGIGGCNVEQQLEAALRALYKNRDFVADDHMLAVLIVTDEEDCSIESPGLFDTPEWQSGSQVDQGTFSVACNWPEEHDTFLFDPNRYFEDLVALKKGRVADVVFAAVVGVPDGTDSPCVGDGDYLAERECLTQTEMKLVPEYATNEDGISYIHFRPACMRPEGSVGPVTLARPGRRFVEMAELFGSLGYVQSICSENWRPVVTHITSHLSAAVANASCRVPEPLLVVPAESAKPCTDCVVSNCNLFAEIIRTGDQASSDTCPTDLEFGAEADYYEMVSVSIDSDRTRMLCPIKRLSSEVDCASAHARHASTAQAGWYYCRNGTLVENTEYTCSDGMDNDSDGLTDCAEEFCKSCAICGAAKSGCALGCADEIALTGLAEEITTGSRLLLDCPIYQ